MSEKPIAQRNSARLTALRLGLALAVVANVVSAAVPTEEFAQMRDEVKLAANVFLPEGAGPFPVIVTRTPYLKDGERWAEGASKYTDAGFAYVVQDTRGKGHSEGFYRAFQDDLEDGYDTIEWLATRPWSNGRIGITGGSAMGITGNLAAIANPPHLQAAYIVVAPSSRFKYTFFNGVFKEADSGNWLRGQGVEESVINATKARVTWSASWALSDIESLRRNIDIPMFNVGGWYDIFSEGAIGNFSYLQNHGQPGARGNQKVLMGPFGHGPLSGDLQYPDGRGNADQELRWFEYWLQDVDNGIMDEPPVTFYMMGAARKGALSAANGFREAANWPLATRQTRLYLGENQALENSAGDAGRYRYRFDPQDPVATQGGGNLTFERGPMDQRAIGERGDYLRFETDTLDADVSIAGNVLVELWAATDGPDTDFMVKLVDVYPDGYEALVLDAPIRTRYRFGRDPEDVRMMAPDVPEKLVIDLWSTAITFEAGHKIALHVTSSNSPRFEVNPNDGSAPGAVDAKPRTARNTVHFGADKPSALVLPVIYE